MEDYREMVQQSIVFSGVIPSFGILKSYRSIFKQDGPSVLEVLFRNPNLNCQNLGKSE